jgi:hypothetical protein
MDCRVTDTLAVVVLLRIVPSFLIYCSVPNRSRLAKSLAIISYFVIGFRCT